METEFIAILQKIVAEQGKETLLNATKCKAFLLDYTRGEYKKESRFLLQALDAGVQKAIDKAENITICKKQQIMLLHEDYGLDEKVAADVVDTLALVLRGDVPQRENGTPSSGTKSDAVEYLTCGRHHVEEGQYDAAIGDFNEAIRLRPNYAFAYMMRGYVYFHKGQYDAVIHDLNEAIKLDPNDASAYAWRGEAYRFKGEYDAAIQDFEKALSLDSDLEWVREELQEIR